MIRRARPHDRATVEVLLRLADLPLDGVAENFEDFVVAETKGAIVGAAGLEVYGYNGLLRFSRGACGTTSCWHRKASRRCGMQARSGPFGTRALFADYDGRGLFRRARLHPRASRTHSRDGAGVAGVCRALSSVRDGAVNCSPSHGSMVAFRNESLGIVNVTCPSLLLTAPANTSTQRSPFSRKERLSSGTRRGLGSQASTCPVLPTRLPKSSV